MKIVHHRSSSSSLLIVSLHFLLASLFILTTTSDATRINRRQSDQPDDNGTTIGLESFSGNEPFVNISELKNVQLKELLEVQFINNSVNHIQNKIQRVHTSLQDQIQQMVSGVRGVKGQFSPELKQKLNDSFFKLVESLELSPYCLASLNHIKVELANKRLWPLKFIDAMEFVPKGLFDGVMTTLGVYEECINIESPMVKWNDIRGKYCMGKVHLPILNPTFTTNEELEVEPQMPMDLNSVNSNVIKKLLFSRLNLDFDEMNNKLKLLQMINMFNGSYYRIGLCFPSTCSSFELERAINKFLDPVQNPIRFEIEGECSVKNQPIELNNYQLIAFFVLAVLALLVGASTCYEYYLTNYRDDSEAAKSQYDSYLLTFSALSNTKALFEPDRNRLCAVDTLLLGFVCMEFIGRSYVLPVFYGMMNIKRALNGLPKEYFTARKFFFIRGSSFAACTYILTSAIILSYKICAAKQNTKPSIANYLKFVANRWLSLTRRLIGPIFLLYLMPLAGDGPMWHYFEKIYSEPCKNNLLPTFLYYSNYASSMDEVCNQPTIVFSTIFYLSLIAPIVLYMLSHKTVGYVVFISLIVIGSIVTLIPKLLFNLPVAPYEISMMTSVAQSKLSFIHYFAATDQYIVVFLLGLFVGFLIKCKPNINLGKKLANLALWIGMMSLPLISTSWNESFKPVEGNFSQFSFVTWFYLSKIMWCAGFSWVMFTCCTGRAGPINDAMSMPLLRPLTKLAFGVYLNHITIQGFRQLTKKEVSPLTHTEILTDDIADLVISFAVSYIFYILIERPFYYWIKIVIQHEKPNTVKRFSVSDLENGKLKEEIDLKPLNDCRL